MGFIQNFISLACLWTAICDWPHMGGGGGGGGGAGDCNNITLLGYTLWDIYSDILVFTQTAHHSTPNKLMTRACQTPLVP